MKVSELILALQKLLVDHGDIAVHVPILSEPDDDGYSGTILTEAVTVEFNDGWFIDGRIVIPDRIAIEGE
jgi:hypothetical protein